MGVYVKGNPKEGEYKLIKTTDGFVFEGKDFAYACIEIEEPKVGKWIEEYNGNGWNDYWDYTCSNCGKKYERADILYKANYCPNCGAKMESE